MTGVDMDKGDVGATRRVPDELRLLQQATNAVAEAVDEADALARVAELVAQRTGWRICETGGLAVPVLAGDEEVAVLRFDTDGDHDRADVEVVSLVAAQIGAQVRRRQLEDQLAAANAELRRSNADLAEFAYVASHDLSEPLRVISGHVQLLARRYQGQLGDDADRYIGFAVDGCARLQTLITDLLEYSRVGQTPLKAEPVDCNHVVAEALAGLAGAPAAEVVVGDLPTVAGDAGQLRQLFANLLANALKFTASGYAAVIEVRATVEGDTARFTVADRGIGVPARHRERVFRMFQRLHGRDEYEGTGMGLAICRRIVERHHGHIDVDDTPGGGATFAFTLPIFRSAA